MNGLYRGNGIFFRILDIVVVIGLVELSTRMLDTPAEPLGKTVILAVWYGVFLHALAFYDPHQFEPERRTLATLLVILFAASLSILTMVGLYFRPHGRRILILHAVFMLIYLMIRSRLLSKVAAGIKHRFILQGIDRDGLPPHIWNRIGENGEILSENGSGSAPGNGIGSDYVIIGEEYRETHQLPENLLQLKLSGLPVYTMIGFWEHFFKQIPIDLVSPAFFFERSGFDRAGRRLHRVTKRLLDVVLALALLLPAAPFMLIIGLLIRLESRGPALFRQTRTGMNGKPFTMIKFRSMRNDAEKEGAQWSHEDDPRITRFGGLIRRLRLDELPQLFNVLSGNMSFVGPRPERPEFDQELKKDVPYYMLRYLVKPGLTGWAQVNYGYCASVDDTKEKIRYDLYYVKHASFMLDVDIFLKTARTVLLAKGR